MIIPSWGKWTVGVVMLVLAFLGGWYVRGLQAVATDSKAVAKQATAQVVTDHKQAAVTAGVDASGATREERQAVVYRTINREVTRYEDKQSDGSGAAGECMLDAEWVRWHDAAAVGKLPDAAGAGHDSSSAAATDR